MAQLVLSTLHTTSAADTAERILDAFPPNQQRQIRIQLSMVAQATVARRLMPSIDGGTTPVLEGMVMNTAIRNLIREEKSHQIGSVIAAGDALGMQTMDQGLFKAVKDGIVAKDVALQHANHPEALAHHFEAEGMWELKSIRAAGPSPITRGRACFLSTAHKGTGHSPTRAASDPSLGSYVQDRDSFMPRLRPRA